MPVRYTRVGWQDAPSTDTPIDAANLNHMDNGILALSQEVDTELDSLREDFTSFEEETSSRVITLQNSLPTMIGEQIDTKFGDSIGDEVTSWLTEHVDPAGSAVVVDDTLSVEGAAADAEKTGTLIRKNAWTGVCSTGITTQDKVINLDDATGFIDGVYGTNILVNFLAPNKNASPRLKVGSGIAYPVAYPTSESPYYQIMDAEHSAWGLGVKRFMFMEDCWLLMNPDFVHTDSELDEVKDGLSDIHPSAANSTENTNNLLVMNPKYFGNVINGLTLNKSNDGTIYVNGTASANVDIPVTGEYVTDKALSFPAGTYTFALFNMFGFSNTNRCYVRYAYDLTSAATNIVWQSNNARTATVTFTQDAYVFIQLYSGATYSNAYFQLQIEKGTNASPTFSMPPMMADYKARLGIEKLSGSTNESKKINNDSYNVGVDFPKSFGVSDILDDLSTITASAGKSESVYTHRFQRHNNGYCLTNDGSSGSMYINFYVNDPISFYGVQEFDIALYIPSNAANISRLRFRCVTAGYDAYRQQTFVNGWNFIRIGMNGTGQGASVTENRFMFYVYYADSTVVTPVYLCAVQAVKPPHASVVFVEDAGYGSFYDSAYPLLTAIGCPVTWALECANIHESREGTRSLISLSELTSLENDGISDFSWHGYSGEKTIELDAEETAEYNLKCLRFLAKRGDITGKIFRAVWPGNTAPNYEIAINDLDAAATYDATADLVIYPYPNKYNIPRISLQSRDTAWIDSMISQLQNTHQTVYIYTHGIIDSSSFDPQGQDMRLDMLQYLITKLQGGISDGWLKCTTYNRLEREYWS